MSKMETKPMKVFVWHRVNQCSESYHSEGGIVVFADSLERAIELAQSAPECVIAADEKPDEIREVVGGDERLFIMPDAGCCG